MNSSRKEEMSSADGGIMKNEGIGSNQAFRGIQRFRSRQKRALSGASGI
jgi:hypothetical protein